MQLFEPAPRRVGRSIRSRLYAIIFFLGLLPVLGAGFALYAIAESTADNTALDRAASGTIHLERINGLVYAVEMESRGIYMSPDWATAEPLATNLMRDLSSLKEIALIWHGEAIVSQRGNVDELAHRINEFVRFRTELVRLGKENSTAAARAFGDNDANRKIRSALNDSLSTIARAYEQEIGEARAKVELNERRFMFALTGLAVLAFIALLLGMALINSGLLAPLSLVRQSMLRLAQGDLDADAGTNRPAAEIAEMERAIDVFRTGMLERSRLSHETRLLSELNEWLQSCNSLTELYNMVAEFLSRLLPGCAGSLYIFANSRDVLEGTKSWNGGKLLPAMPPEDCWGLRRGHVYNFGDNEIGFDCGHIGGAEHGDYCCIPILAHGETIGLLHLEFRDRRDDEDVAAHRDEVIDERRLGLVCAEQISLAIANVKLRDQLKDQSIRDTLTGLFNRRYMLETCRREFSRAARARQPVSVLAIDVDHFKKFNDNHGHDAGDTVLREVGACMEAVFRNEDVACRFGGEEFVVILPGAAIEDAAKRAEQLRAKIEALSVRYLDHNLPRITISIGIAAFPEAGDNPQLVLKIADDALYRAKENGRNRIELSAITEPVRRKASVRPLGPGADKPEANRATDPGKLAAD